MPNPLEDFEIAEGVCEAVETLAKTGDASAVLLESTINELAAGAQQTVDLNALSSVKDLELPEGVNRVFNAADPNFDVLDALDWRQIGASGGRSGVIGRFVGDFHGRQFFAARYSDPVERGAFIRSLGIPQGGLREQLARASIEANRPQILSSISHVDGSMYRAINKTEKLDRLSQAINAGDPQQITPALENLFSRTSYERMMDRYGG